MQSGRLHVGQLITGLLLLASCGPPVKHFPSIDAIATLTRGTSVDEVERLAGQRGEHQFTVDAEGTHLLCIGYLVEHEFGALYLIFEDGTLVHIVEPPASEFGLQDTVLDDGTPARVAVRLPVDPAQRLSATLVRTDLGANQIRNLIESRRPPDRGVLPRDSGGLLLAWIVSGAWLWKPIDDFQRRTRINRMAEECDPTEITIGMTQAEVHDHCGAPLCIVPLESERQLEVHRHFCRNGTDYYSPAPVGVFFDKGQVTAVYSHAFSPTALLQQCPGLAGSSSQYDQDLR